MTMPSQSLRAVKQGREGWRQLATGCRMTQLAIRTLAFSILKHYPHDYQLDEYWSKDVCEHGDDREFCRKCKAIETPTHKCKCKGYYRKPDQTLIDLLVKIAKDEKTPKLRKGQIMEALKGVTIQGRESDWLYSNEDETNKEEV